MFKGYAIVESLHEGTKSIIYRAKYDDNDQTVIIKSIASHYPKNLEIARLKHEFQLLESLSIPGVPEVLGFEKNENTYYIVIKDHLGVPVKAYLKQGLPDIEVFLEIAVQISQILAEVHAQHILHKDLKPANIIVSPGQQRVQIIDFGLANRLLSGSQESMDKGILEGSMPYISPEQTGRMNRPVDYRSDLYSLGITLFELVTGQLPFSASHPLEWVHVHLAQEAPNPQKFRPDLPDTIAAIIQKLMAKTSEDRYQSAFNLKKDLINCLTQWKEKRSIDPFELAAGDTFGLFMMPAKLYGRDAQIEQLSEVMSQVIRQHKPQLILVSGYSGIGKTAFVQEARKQISIAKGNFISGKFDQLNRGMPYHGFIQAFTELAEQLLVEKEADLIAIKTQLLNALGGNTQIINQLIPAFQIIIGIHPAPPPLLPEEASNRFLQTLKTFVKTLARPERPLIIFTDDLQWADVASLSLLESLAADHELQSIGFIGTYRDNEIDIAHPLTPILAKIKAVMPVHEIHLNNLPETAIRSLLADTFQKTEEEARSLAALLLEKTQGNPFFLTQSLSNLYEEKRIKFDASQGKWTWIQKELNGLNITDNVIELMVSKIQKLPLEAQQALKLSACIGNEFSLRLLSCIATPPIMEGLKHALEQSLISSMDNNYVVLADSSQLLKGFAAEHDQADARFKFLHDRVQQAAYSLLSEAERKAIHLKLGQNLSRMLNKEERIENIFTICNHLNKGRENITTTADKNELAEFNLQAGKKAREATAYVQALEYITSGISLLDSSAAVQNYPLWKGLHYELALCYYLTARMAQAEKVYDELIQYSQNRLDKLMIYRAMIDMYSTAAMHKEVIQTVEATLALFNLKIPLHTLSAKIRIMTSIAEIKWRLRNKTNHDVLNIPKSSDEEHIKLAELLLEAGPSVFFSNQDLFAWLVLFEVRYALRYGTTPSSALGFTGYGMIMHAAFGDVKTAFSMAELGEKLNEKFNNVFPYHQLKFVANNFINHLKLDVNPILEDYARLGKMALAAGDYLYLGLLHYVYIALRAALGHPIEDILKESRHHLAQLSQLNNSNGYDLVICEYQSLLALAGQPLLPWDLNQSDATLESKLVRLKKESSFVNISILYYFIYKLNYLLDLYEEDIASRLLTGNLYVDYINRSYTYVDFALYHSLCVLKAYPVQPRSIQKKLRTIVKNHHKLIKQRTLHGAINYACYYAVIDAVLSIIDNKNELAIKRLEENIPIFESKKLIHLSAIAKELLGKEYLKRQQEKVAKVYLRESAYDFQTWGANAKVKQMTIQYPALHFYNDAVFNEENLSETLTSSGSKHGLDLSSLMKSTATISGEIVLNKLLPSMISIITENAGAQIGFLVLKKEEDLVLAVKRNINAPEAEMLHDLPLQDADEVAKSVIQYCYRSQDAVVLDNATHDERFKNDVHIQHSKSKSVLCIPILHQGEFRGALYLENNLTAKAFPLERVTVMKILSAQIAVSLDNAMLYRNLEIALNKQVILTEAYSRFTPKEYLRFLGHTSILDVKLGDYRSEEMTVLFCDIRSYTTIAEQFTPEENFKFLSAYLETMTKIITMHNGMVNQLLGDGILAFFPNPNDALQASIEMQLCLQNYTVDRPHAEPIRIKAGIGLHTGEVIIGIMGNAQNMDTGIVSDTVNAASRIEGLTKYFGVNILLSEKVVERLDPHKSVAFRFIGRVRMKGKLNDIGLYECFDGDLAEMKAQKLATLASYQQAFELYCSKQFEQAAAEFGQLTRVNAADPVLKYYHQQTAKLIDEVVPENWNPVEEIEIK